jgi:hypothetical protein
VPYPPEQKAAAERNQDRVNTLAIAAGFAGSTLALVPVAGPFIGAGCGVLAGALGLRGIQQGRIVRDPPREDFDVATRLGPPRFNVSELASSPVEVSIVDLVSTTDKLTRLVEANVVAVERAEGAQASGARTATRHRVREALRFAEEMSQELFRSSNLAEGMSRSMRNVFGAESREVTELTAALESLATADEEWAAEIRRGLGSGTFLEGFNGSEGVTSL